MRPEHLAWMAAVGWMAASACAPRALPASFPETSAAAANAQPAEPASVTTALDEDPPLPGEDTRHWKGLHKATSAQGHDDSHRDRSHHAIPGPAVSEHSGAAAQDGSQP